MSPFEIETADYHTGGEPFRIVTGGVDVPEGQTVLDRRTWSQERLDEVRLFLINEPRGHADMYGCFVTPGDDDAAAFGLVFFHKDGFSTACGHGTIAAATWALETGRIAATPPITSFSVDVPSGRLAVSAETTFVNDEVNVGRVGFINVPSWVSATAVAVPGLPYRADVSYGGAFYASVDVSALGIPIVPEHLERLVKEGRAIKQAMDDHDSVQHPVDDRLSGCYGTIWYEHLGASDDVVRQRNVAIFADGEVDRSPCGSGTSARLALLHQSGQNGSGIHSSTDRSSARSSKHRYSQNWITVVAAPSSPESREPPIEPGNTILSAIQATLSDLAFSCADPASADRSGFEREGADGSSGLVEMPQRFSVFIGVGPGGKISINILHSRLDSIEKISHLAEGRPGHEYVVRTQAVGIGSLASLIGTLAMRPFAIGGRSPGTGTALESHAAPAAAADRF